MLGAIIKLPSVEFTKMLQFWARVLFLPLCFQFYIKQVMMPKLMVQARGQAWLDFDRLWCSALPLEINKQVILHFVLQCKRKEQAVEILIKKLI